MKKLLFLACSATLLFSSCKDNKGTDNGSTNFDQGQLLTQLADNYIRPGYDSLYAALEQLEMNWNSFKTNPTESSLISVQNKWKNANLNFQRVKMFDFGPAMTYGLAAALGTYPCDTAQIESNIVTPNVNLSSSSNIDAIGFDALDYLLFSSTSFNRTSNNQSVQKYIDAIILKMKTEVQSVRSDWSSYRSTFITGTGSSSTTPFALFINSYCKDFEFMKNAKIGFPNGTQSLGIPQLHYLEAKNATFGKELLIANAKALHAIFNGMGYTNGDGVGLREYLEALSKKELATTINDRLISLYTQPSAWSSSIKSMIQNNQQTVTDYYSYLQATTVFLKADMTGAFGVLITYQDNDGD